MTRDLPVSRRGGDSDVPASGAPVVPIRIPRTADPADLAGLRGRLADAGLPGPWPVVVLVGGAGGMSEADGAHCAAYLAAALPALERHGGALVDGGTDSGVMALAGLARRAAGGRVPHVGVAVAALVRAPRADHDDAPDGGVPSGEVPGDQRADLEPSLTHLVLVPGSDWGEEAPWLAAVASALAGPAPSVTLLANGGAIAYHDVRHSLAAGRPVVVLAGTGRTADALADLRRDPDRSRARAEPVPEDAVELAGSALLSVVDDPGGLARALDAALLRSVGPWPGAGGLSVSGDLPGRR